LGINVRDISFAYGDTKVFSDVSFNIPTGELWALVGRSGSGKTTLLHVIAGLFIPKNGCVLVDGRGNGPGRIRGVVFQDEALLGWLSTEENLLFPNHRHPTEKQIAKVRSLLSKIGLYDRRQAHPHELSTGMRKRLEFGRALLADDEYILADEPFGPVDIITRRKLWKMWLELNQSEPRTGILCTHDAEEAIRLCDAIVPLTSNLEKGCGSALRVPDKLKKLGVYGEDSYFWSFKQQVIELLE